MINSRELKSRALGTLQGKWLRIMALVLIVSLIPLLFNMLYSALTADIVAEIAQLVTDIEGQRLRDPWAGIDQLLDKSQELSYYSIINIIGTILSFAFEFMLVIFLVNLTQQSTTARFMHFSRIWEAIKLYLLMYVKIALWSLLLIVPGIIKAFAYSQAPFIKAENPEMSCREAIQQSKQLMNGYKASLLGLYVSFFGWMLLTGIIGGLLTTLVDRYIGSNHYTLSLIINDILSVLVLIPLSAYIWVTRAHFYDVLNSHNNYTVPNDSNFVSADQIYWEDKDENI